MNGSIAAKLQEQIQDGQAEANEAFKSFLEARARLKGNSIAVATFDEKFILRMLLVIKLENASKNVKRQFT